MRNSLYKYVKTFSIGFLSSIEYRANFIMSIVSCIFPIVMQCFLWTAIFNNTGKQTVYGYSYIQLIVYSILAGLVSRIVSAGVEREICEDIKNGGLNKYIIKPLNYFMYRISCYFGGKVLQLGVMFLIMAVTLTILNHYLEFHLEPERILQFIISLSLSLALNFLIYYCLSTVTFWVSEAWAMFGILGLIFNIAGGGVFPLDIFGKRVSMILNVLPFKYTIYYPITIINGSAPLNSFLSNIAVQFAWILLLLVTTKLLWKLGMKKYIAVGG